MAGVDGAADVIGYGGDARPDQIVERVQKLTYGNAADLPVPDFQQPITDLLREQELRRVQNRHDRLEFLARAQQVMMIGFIAFVLTALLGLGIWAAVVVMTCPDGANVDVAWHVLSVLVDAGIAATVGFLAVRTFER